MNLLEVVKIRLGQNDKWAVSIMFVPGAAEEACALCLGKEAGSEMCLALGNCNAPEVVFIEPGDYAQLERIRVHNVTVGLLGAACP